MKPEEALENLKVAVKAYHESGDSWNESDNEMDEALKIAIKAITEQQINDRSKVLKWHKCTRKNGAEFLKLIYYSPYLDGYAELGRFNMTKCEAQNNEWTLSEIMKELE